MGKIPWRREWLPTPVFLPGEFHGQKSLVGYCSPWGCKRSDTTEWLTLSLSSDVLGARGLRLPEHICCFIPLLGPQEGVNCFLDPLVFLFCFSPQFHFLFPSFFVLPPSTQPRISPEGIVVHSG